MQTIANTNNQFTQEPYNYETLKGGNKLYIGQVVSVNRNNHLFLTYDVRLLDHNNAVVACQVMTQGSSFNGVGRTTPLDIDTPVLVLCKENHMQFGFIIGTFATWGNYDEIYEEGKLQEYNTSDLFNQPFNHTSRITQPDSAIEVYPSKVQNNIYDTPELYEEEERVNHRPRPGVIKIHNTSGDAATYTPGQQVLYSEGNIIQVSGGTKVKKATRLLNFAKIHFQKARLYKPLIPKEDEEADFQDLDGIQHLAIQPDSVVGRGNYISLKNGNIDLEYLVKNELKLAVGYQELARTANSTSHGVDDEIDRASEAVNADDIEVSSNYKPTIKESGALPEEKVQEPDATLGDVYKYLIFHNAGKKLEETLAVMQDSTNLQSYHVLVDGDNLVELIKPEKRSLAVGNVYVTSKEEKTDLISYNIGFIVKDNFVNANSYRTAAYIVNKYKERLTNTSRYTHGELEEKTSDEVKDKLEFNKDTFEKVLKKFN